MKEFLQQQGSFKQANYFDNIGGLNTADSPFKVLPSQITDGTNFDYIKAGSIKKSLGATLLNSVANSQLRTLGLGIYEQLDSTKTVIRAAGTKIQTFVPDAGTFTNLTEDSISAGSNFLTSGSTQPVVFSQFNTALVSTLWLTGGGMTLPYAVYSTSKATLNGSAVAAGSIATSLGGAGAAFASTGTYWYAVVLHKASTGALSNASLDASFVVTDITKKVVIDLTGITAFDTNKYDQIWIYRSATNGVTGFTSGDLIAEIASTSTSYTDTGSAILDAELVPRANNLVLDNSTLGAATYNNTAVFKRRLVVSSNNAFYLSDINKPESWPTGNVFTLPYGGKITGLAVINFNTPTTSATDEYLCIFQEQHLWVLTGSDLSDWALKFIDTCGCPSQPLIVLANGFLSWVGYRGVFIWDGSGKPILASRPISDMFSSDTDLDKTKFIYGYGVFYHKQNQIQWQLSSKTYGEQKYQLKFDLRLSLPGIQDALDTRIMDGVFSPGSSAEALYAGVTYIPPGLPEEAYIAGDGSGFMYKMFNAADDASAVIDFKYTTGFLDQNEVSTAKRYQYVVLWCEDLGDTTVYLDYWTDYKTADSLKRTKGMPLSTKQTNTMALWDVAYWDVASWDDYSPSVIPVVFRLDSVEGDCIRLQFRQAQVITAYNAASGVWDIGEWDTAFWDSVTSADVSGPLIIHGFTVLYSDLGVRK